MRLLNIKTLKFAIFNNDNRPKYVIASHRWVEGAEVTYQDVLTGTHLGKGGYQKILDFAKYVREHVRSVEWLWVDTCCINKDSAAELSEAINLMFEWYRGAEVCIAYLVDVEKADDKGAFEKSEWFKRGWTLQELLAPRLVVFVTKGWDVIGSKGASTHGNFGIHAGTDLGADIASITGIPEHALHDFRSCFGISVADKLKWMEGRATTKEEDMSYALFGIFEVAPGANYGERFEGARQRLLKAIHYEDDRKAEQAERFQRIVKWLSPPDPWTNHRSARQLQEAHTGSWLVKTQDYRDWKAASTRHLWMYGKAGCGKTVLCSMIIEDIKQHCRTRPNSGYAVFYFTFSDQQKQSPDDMLLSLVAQLGWKEPAFSMLQQAHDKPNRTVPGFSELESIFMLCLKGYDELYLLIDAIDECPEEGDNRHQMMKCLANLSQQSEGVKIFATSRELVDVHESMMTLGAKPLSIVTASVDADIRRYISTQLSSNKRLSRFDQKSKALIEGTLSRKSDGMFRWAFCQLQQLKKLKSTKPSFVKTALFSLPSTLDETYARTLNAIDDNLRQDALILLRWLAYARFPPTLGTLMDATIVDLTGEGTVHWEDRPGLGDALEILAELVVTVKPDNGRYLNGDSDSSSNSNAVDGHSVKIADGNDAASNIEHSSHQDVARSDLRSDASSHYFPEVKEDHEDDLASYHRISKGTKVRLAHFSVKEYLEAERILETSAKGFYLDSGREHQILAQSCLEYLMNYSDSEERLATSQDSTTFPLLEYAANGWVYHAKLQLPMKVERERRLLCSEKYLHDWLLWQTDFCEYVQENPGPALYYASLLGLDAVVGSLLEAGADVNAPGGPFRYALQAATIKGNKNIVQMLLHAGADIDAEGGQALRAASVLTNGAESIVRMLLDAGGNVNMPGGEFGNALQHASVEGHRDVIQMLLDAGADVNSLGGFFGTALQAASCNGHKDVVRMLLDAEAGVNAQGGQYGNALQGASMHGHKDVVRMLLDAGADVNAQGGEFGNALQAAALLDYDDVVQMLIVAGADIHAKGGLYGTAWRAALSPCSDRVMQLLLDAVKPGDFLTHRKELEYVLYRAHIEDYGTIVQMLLNVGVELPDYSRSEWPI